MVRLQLLSSGFGSFSGLLEEGGHDGIRRLSAPT